MLQLQIHFNIGNIFIEWSVNYINCLSYKYKFLKVIFHQNSASNLILEIFQLEDDELTLEKRVKELESDAELTKPDGRTYSPEIRMKVFDDIVA